jgi:hypothetical protein
MKVMKLTLSVELKARQYSDNQRILAGLNIMLLTYLLLQHAGETCHYQFQNVIKPSKFSLLK